MTESAPIRVCRADCVLAAGRSLELLVSELSLGGAFIVAMVPPQLGTRMALMLLPEGHDPVGPIDARVIGTRLDPSNALKSGFELLFPDVDETTFDELALLVARFETPEPAVARATLRGQAEKRQFPRVNVNLRARVRCEAGSFYAQVKNLSMAGALFVIDGPDAGSPPVIEVTTAVELTIVGTKPEDEIELKAEVVRLGQGMDAGAIGVRFNDVGDAAGRLEALMIDAIWLGPGD